MNFSNFNFNKYREAILYGSFIIIVLIFLLSKIVPIAIQIVRTNVEVKNKQTQYVELQEELKKLEEYEKIKKASINQMKKVYKPVNQTGSNIEIDFADMTGDIINIVKYNNAKIYSISNNYNPPSDEFYTKSEGKYNACQIDFELVLDYASLENILSDILKYPYLININTIKIIPYQKDKSILLAKLQLILYSEATESEKAANQQALKQGQEGGADPNQAQTQNDNFMNNIFKGNNSQQGYPQPTP
ncbi:MAG: hypothetical protein MJ229_03510 [bacterium]|nr:hypothetical protein [bacterium]